MRDVGDALSPAYQPVPTNADGSTADARRRPGLASAWASATGWLRGAATRPAASGRAAAAATAAASQPAEAANVPAGNAADLGPEPRDDTYHGARWVEDALPFTLLLLMVLLHRHLFGLLAFAWLTSLLHNANVRMRRQALLKEHRSVRDLSLLGLMLCGQVLLVVALQGRRLFDQVMVVTPPDYAAEPPPLPTLVWDVVIADVCARAATLLVKSQLALCFSGSPSASRKLRSAYSVAESCSLTYRTLLPAPLWYHWFLHSAPFSAAGPALWSLSCSHLYIAFKLVSLVDRTRGAAKVVRTALLQQLPVGRYASADEVAELGDGECTVCQEGLNAPVSLECGHIFCEECIVAWCERNASDATCPLCRASINSALGQHSDGTTSLLPQVF